MQTEDCTQQNSLLTVQQASNRASISDDTIRRSIHRGEIPAYRVGRQFRINGDDLEVWLNNSRFIPESVPMVKSVYSNATASYRW